MASSTLNYKGMLKGHQQGQWVTSVVCPLFSTNKQGPSIVASGSRDKSVIVWEVNDDRAAEGLAGSARCLLKKHNQPVSDVVFSSFGDYILSCSWDKTMRLWDVQGENAFRTFVSHTSDVTSGSLSNDNRQIVSSSRDKTIRLWNTLGHQKFVLEENQHTEWITCVRFSPETEKSMIVSCGWDNLTKVWDLKRAKLVYDFIGHNAPVDTLTVSPDGSLCASGGADGWAMLWDIVEGNHLYSLEAGSAINSLAFSPCNYWLCAATNTSIKIWDLEKKKVLSDVRLVPQKATGTVSLADYKKASARDAIEMHTFASHPTPAKHHPWCTSLTWSADGETLFAGSANGNIYVFGLKKQSS